MKKNVVKNNQTLSDNERNKLRIEIKKVEKKN